MKAQQPTALANLLNTLPRMVHHYEHGLINDEEFVGKLMTCFDCEDLNPKDASDVAALIPSVLHAPVRKQIDATLAPDYVEIYPFTGAPDLRTTARQRAFAAALKPFFPNDIRLHDR